MRQRLHKGSKDAQPKVHLFEKLDTFSDKLTIMVIGSKGEKYQASFIDIKEYLLREILKDLENVKKKVSETKVTKTNLLKAFAKDSDISLGKPYNIMSSNGIEKKGKNGVIYSDDNQVRVNLGGTWHTIFDKNGIH